jgi:hypothetical protein
MIVGWASFAIPSILAGRFINSLVNASGSHLRHTAISRQVDAGDEAAVV